MRLLLIPKLDRIGSRIEYEQTKFVNRLRMGWLNRFKVGDTLIGARFSHHSISPQLQAGTISLECDSLNSFTCLNLAESIKRTDEWYVFSDNPRPNGFTVLYTLDETGLSMNGNIPILASGKDFGMGDDHPIVWYKCLPNGGRTFYSAMGHTGAAFTEAFHLELLEKGIRWAGKLEGACN